MLKEERTHFPGCVGANVHPCLGSIEPEDACCPLGVVRHYERDGSIQSHGGIQLVLVDVHVVEPIRIPISERTTHLGLIPGGKKQTKPDKLENLHFLFWIQPFEYSLCCFEPGCVRMLGDAIDVLNAWQRKV